MYTCMLVCLLACMHAYIHTYIHTHIHTYTHAYPHAYIQTDTHLARSLGRREPQLDQLTANHVHARPHAGFHVA